MEVHVEHPAHYSQVRHLIRDGDLLNWHGRSSFSKLIRWGGKRDDTHSDMAIWEGRTLMAAGMLARGGRQNTLSSQVDRYPGQIQVFSFRDDKHPEGDLDGAAEYMLRLCDLGYGWGALVLAVLRRFVLPRKYLKIEVNLTKPLHASNGDKWLVPALPPFCSMAWALAWEHGGGVDPCPDDTALFTEPWDLVDSPVTLYRWTLYPDHYPLPAPS